jgi:hypothetical protein
VVKVHNQHTLGTGSSPGSWEIFLLGVGTELVMDWASPGVVGDGEDGADECPHTSAAVAHCGRDSREEALYQGVCGPLWQRV